MALPLPFQSCVGLASLNIISPVVNPSMGSRICLRSVPGLALLSKAGKLARSKGDFNSSPRK